MTQRNDSVSTTNTAPRSTSARNITGDKARHQVCADLGINPHDAFDTAQATFAANRKMHMENGADLQRATVLAIADLFLAGILVGRGTVGS
jgi:hypothetical protein